MKKLELSHWIILCTTIGLVVGNLVMAVIMLQVKAENTFMRTAFGSYTVANGKSWARERLKNNPDIYKGIAGDYFIDDTVLKITSIQENLGDAFSHGVKKVPEAAVLTKDPREWQARGVAKIYIEELQDFVFKQRDGETPSEWLKRVREYWNYFGARYCYWDASYGDNLFTMWKKEKNISVAPPIKETKTSHKGKS